MSTAGPFGKLLLQLNTAVLELREVIAYLIPQTQSFEKRLKALEDKLSPLETPPEVSDDEITEK